MGSMNYAKYSRRRKEFVFKIVFENSFDDDHRAARGDERAAASGPSTSASTRPRRELDPLLDMGVLQKPLHVSFIMGVIGGIPPTARNLAAMAEQRAGRWRTGA